MIRDHLFQLNQTCCSLLQSLKPNHKLKMFKPYQVKEKKTHNQQLTPKKMIKHSISLKDLRKKRDCNIKSKKNIEQQNNRVSIQINNGFKKDKTTCQIKKNQQFVKNKQFLSPRISYYQTENAIQSPRSIQTMVSTRQLRCLPPINIIFSYNNREGSMNQQNNPQKKQMEESIEPLALQKLHYRYDGVEAYSPRTVVSLVVESERNQSIVLEKTSRIPQF